MTFVYELDPYWRCTGFENVNFQRQGFRKLSSDRQTDMTEIINHAAFAGGQKTDGHENLKRTVSECSPVVEVPPTVCGGNDLWSSLGLKLDSERVMDGETDDNESDKAVRVK